jgi:hypothetical protein
LVEEDDAKSLRIEKSPMHKLAATAWTAVHEQHRDSKGRPTLFEVKLVRF